jgi:catecholate siderophore receptor
MSERVRNSVLLFFLGGAILFRGVAAAAEPSAQSRLQGCVLDPSGRAIVGASVIVMDTRTAAAALATDASGEFAVALPAGSYSVAVSAAGFTAQERSVAIGGSPVRIAIELQLASPSELITVTASVSAGPFATSAATKTLTPLVDIPQAVSLITSERVKEQMMASIGDAVRFVPGVTATQGENNRDQVIIRGNSSSADFFVNGVRDDVQFFRDLYNADSVEVLKGPNAMIFGRGGGGGVINRNIKTAGFAALHEIDLQGGSFGDKRIAADLDQPLSSKVAVRLNAMFEDAGSFRDYGGLRRYGLNPAMTYTPGAKTLIGVRYERFLDNRNADRGIPSFGGVPADVSASQFFGNPNDGWVRADVNSGSAFVEHQFDRMNLRSSTFMADYDRGYQNYVPGAVSADRSTAAMSAYNNATARRNFFNQTDLSYPVATGRLRHILLWGAEAGSQSTSNFRRTGYFNNVAISINAPFDNPVISTPVIFRQSATDADNHIGTTIAAGYVQDQIELSRYLQLLAGLRFDRFYLQFHNNRTAEDLRRVDHLLSPRAGIVIKPAASVSLYGSYNVSSLPSAGDQFSSLTTVTQQVKPETFRNLEAGAKWDLHRGFALTAAVYRLDRMNTRSTDPNDPTRINQTGRQRTNGIELEAVGSLTRRWRVAGGYSLQDAYITAATASARAGATVAQVPHQTFSLWNTYQILRRLSAGAGVLNRADMYAGIDNTVNLPGYMRVDAAAYYSVTERIRIQGNVENLLDRRYYLNADGNNNISPGSPRAVRVGMIARF